MGGVTVTDGYTFAQSDEQGIFTLDADDQALFISLVTPSGYLAPLDGGIPQFYRAYDPAAKRYDFELATVARLGRMLRTAGDRRSAAQDRRAFPAVVERGHARIAGGNR